MATQKGPRHRPPKSSIIRVRYDPVVAYVYDRIHGPRAPRKKKKVTLPKVTFLDK